MSKTLGLGKGLSAIFETETQNINGAITHSSELELAKIRANASQPRTNFDSEALEELAASIKRLGVIQPITVRELDGDNFEIISGERRYRAAILAGISKIPAYIRTANDSEILEMALVENVQREELDPIEIALTIRRLIDELGVTQQELAHSIGKRRSTVANYLRLLTLSPAVQRALAQRLISMGHAKVIASLEGDEAQEELLAKVIKGELSVRATETLLKGQGARVAVAKRDAGEFAHFSQPLEEIFGKRNIKIESKKKGGRLSISFASALELSQIVERLKN